jgi:UDP-GlcNAc:undecaprenyl-phosphate/decaprenyl-phosphate GlcNAc-1-phosphate transferase
MTFRLIREFLPHSVPTDGRRVLIYGAGDGGEMVLRELRNNSKWNYRPVGFIDDDVRKTGKVINGLQVFEANGSLIDICREKSIQEILISSEKISSGALNRLREICRREDIELKRAQMKIEPVDFE